MIDIGSAPTWRTEAPSTKVSRLSSGIGWPAAIAAVRLAAPAGSTASTAVPGWCSASQARQPASRPPPPTGITTRSGACSSCSTISRITVPWPAITSGWSKAGTWNLPEAIASAVRELGRLLVRVARHPQVHQRSAERTDPVPLLSRGGPGDVDPGAHADPGAGERDALCMVARAGADDAVDRDLARERGDEVVRAAHLVRADDLEVLPLQPHAGPGCGTVPQTELQRGPVDHGAEVRVRPIDGAHFDHGRQAIGSRAVARPRSRR